MEPRYHFISSVILSILLTLYFGWLSVFIFIGGFLIDFDHYLYYLLKKKDWNFKRCLKYFEPNGIFIDELHIFHTIEFWFMMILLSFYFKFIFATLIGMALHQCLDSYDHFVKKQKSGRVKTIYGWLIGMHSQSYYFLKKKNNIDK